MGDHPLTQAAWEAAFAPYAEDTYCAALEMISPDDVVLDIGAGDLRFARRAAARARRVIAIERRAELLAAPCPANLTVLCGDARALPFPPGVTIGVLLMRHCRHFHTYALKLRAIGCQRLITNARWGMDVECLSLAPQPHFDSARPGWYACLCGAVGFKPSAPEAITAEIIQRAQSLETCPACCAGMN
jgi:hypothetical protein